MLACCCSCYLLVQIICLLVTLSAVKCNEVKVLQHIRTCGTNILSWVYKATESKIMHKKIIYKQEKYLTSKRYQKLSIESWKKFYSIRCHSIKIWRCIHSFVHCVSISGFVYDCSDCVMKMFRVTTLLLLVWLASLNFVVYCAFKPCTNLMFPSLSTVDRNYSTLFLNSKFFFFLP